MDNKREWVEVPSGRTYTAPHDKKTYKELIDGIPTGAWKEVYPATTASGNGYSLYYYPPNSRDGTSSY